jgi:hypothetical protein
LFFLKGRNDLPGQGGKHTVGLDLLRDTYLVEVP